MTKISVLLFVLALAACSNKHSGITTGLEGKPLPSFNLLLMDSVTIFNTKNIPTGNPIVVLFFNPYCPYCRAEIQDMIKNIKMLGDTRIYFLSSFPFSSIKKYYEQYKLGNYPNIVVGLDSTVFFGKYYKATGVPYLAVYNKRKELKQAFVGRVGISQIEQTILE